MIRAQLTKPEDIDAGTRFVTLILKKTRIDFWVTHKFDSKSPASLHIQVLKISANVTRLSLISNSEGDLVPSWIWPLFSSMTAGYRREDVPVTTVLQLLRERCVLQQEHGDHDVEDDHHHGMIPCSSGFDDRILLRSSIHNAGNGDASEV